MERKESHGLKRQIQSFVVNMPDSVQRVISWPLALYAHHDQTKRLNKSVKEAASLIEKYSDDSRPRVLIDCGFNNGTTTKAFLDSLPSDFSFYGFEVQKDLKEKAYSLINEYPNRSIQLHFMAVSDSEGTIPYYPSNSMPWGGIFDRIATTTLLNRQIAGHLDYRTEGRVKSIDFSSRLSNIYDRYTSVSGKRPFIAVKMNIEGAEYPVLSKVLRDGNIGKIGLLMAEFHWDQFSEPQRKEFHSQHICIMRALKKKNIPHLNWAE